MRFANTKTAEPCAEVGRLVYDSTIHGHPCRKLMRDYCICETHSIEYMDVHASVWPLELARDVIVEFVRLKKACDEDNPVILTGRIDYSDDKCRYHQHGKDHPRCSLE